MSARLQSTLELAEQHQELPLFGVAKDTKPLGVPRFLWRHKIVKERLTRGAQAQAFTAPGVSAHDQAAPLELGELIGDVALGHEQSLRKFVLRHIWSGPDVRQDVEFHEAEAAGLEPPGGGAEQLSVQPREPQPSDERRVPGVRAA